MRTLNGKDLLFQLPLNVSQSIKVVHSEYVLLRRPGRDGVQLCEGACFLKSRPHPDRIADDALGFGPGDDILVFPSVAYFLPVRDDDEDLGGVLSGPLVGTEQLFSAGKRRVQRRLGRLPLEA